MKSIKLLFIVLLVAQFSFGDEFTFNNFDDQNYDRSLILNPIENNRLSRLWKYVESLISSRFSSNEATSAQALQCVSDLQNKRDLYTIQEFYKWANASTNSEVINRLINEMQIASTKNLSQEELQIRASLLSNIRFALRVREENFLNQFVNITADNCQNLTKHYNAILSKDRIISAPALVR